MSADQYFLPSTHWTNLAGDVEGIHLTPRATLET